MKKFFAISFSISCLLLGGLTIFSCTQDEVPEPKELTFCQSIDATYDGEVGVIINTMCAKSGCHLDVQAPLYSDYAVVRDFAEKIIQRAVVEKTMPADSTTLSDYQLNVLRCWEEAGFPEN